MPFHVARYASSIDGNASPRWCWTSMKYIEYGFYFEKVLEPNPSLPSLGSGEKMKKTSLFEYETIPIRVRKSDPEWFVKKRTR
jgi:hypothetical protein